MLGTDLVSAFKKQQLCVTALDLPEFDITNERHLAEALKDAGIVVNCAAYTDVEKAESEPKLAYKVNGQAVGTLGSLAKDAGIWVVHISTDFVFDGKSDRPYVETDTPKPINTYGKSKLLGEQLLIESGCAHCIIRTEWTYGPGGDNFVTKLIKLARASEKLKVVDDQIGAPTATAELGKVVCELVRKKPGGLFHYASAGYVSRFEMAKFVFDKLNMSVDLSRCRTSDYVSAAARPLNSRLDCSKIAALLDEPIEHWKVSLERFLEQL